MKKSSEKKEGFPVFTHPILQPNPGWPSFDDEQEPPLVEQKPKPPQPEKDKK